MALKGLNSRRGWRGSGRTLGGVLLAVSCAGALFAALATAGVTGLRRSPGSASPGPGGAETRALTIGSLSAAADPRVGLIVTATFKGDIERYLGQGRLANGALALVLRAKAGGRPTTGVLDTGGGLSPIRVSVLTRSSGGVSAGSRLIGVFGPERVQSMTSGRPTVVIRDRNRVIVYIGGAGVSRLELKLFASAPTLAASSEIHGSGSAWRAVVRGKPTDRASLSVDASKLTCAQLESSRAELAGVLTSGVGPELREQEQADRILRATLAGARKGAVVPTVGPHSLASALMLTARKIGQLRSQIARVGWLITNIDNAHKTCVPPPTTSTPTPTPPPAATTTTSTSAPSPSPLPSSPPSVQVVQTDSPLGQSLAPQPGLEMTGSAPPGVPVINVNDQVRYQQFKGLGGAITDSSAWLIGNKMSQDERAALMQDLFGQPSSAAGLTAPPIHLNFVRVGVAATGAMTATPAYSYDDNPPGGSDQSLMQFGIGHDTSYIIPTLQQALQVNPALHILASPWSSPGWMKANNSLDNQNDSGTLLAADYGTYANYLVKFIQAYARAAIPIQAITPANEPTVATPYPGLNLPESAEANFIANYLQPALTAAGLNTGIYGNELSWDQFSRYATPLAADASAGPDLAGTAWHCYFGSPTVMSQLQQQAPSEEQIVDECSPEIRSFGTPEFLISTLRNWSSVDAIWSIALDAGGNPIQTPNHCGGCRGAVSIDQTTGAVTFLPEYYELGQVSAFVRPGAVRIDSPTFVTYGTDASNIETISSGLDDVAFLNPDGSKVLVTYNNSSAPITFAVRSSGSYFSYTIPAHAMTTFVWR